MRAHRFYLLVLTAILLGGLVGYVEPSWGIALKPFGDGFIALIRMLIGPVVFCTVVMGIAGVGDLKKFGRVGVKSLVYFEVVSTFALIIGLVVVNWLKPGQTFHASPASLDAAAVSHYATAAKAQTIGDFFLHIVPHTLLSAFTGGDLLQVLLVSGLFGLALHSLGEKGKDVHRLIETVSSILFKMVAVVMWLAPLGAAGAMAFTIGKFGVKSLEPLAALMGSFYLTCIVFVLLILGPIARFCGFNILKFLNYIRDELFTVLGTSSSETVLINIMQKMEQLGCPRATVGLVVPAGYSFNLDGTNIYITLAAIFVAQALGIHLTLSQELKILAIAIITSKGASGVTGAGFITLAATLSVVPDVPLAGLSLILGVDRFMSEARAITNTIGNAVATVAITKWEGELDSAKLKSELG